VQARDSVYTIDKPHEVLDTATCLGFADPSGICMVRLSESVQSPQRFVASGGHCRRLIQIAPAGARGVLEERGVGLVITSESPKAGNVDAIRGHLEVVGFGR
jgi:hypothetical protein